MFNIVKRRDFMLGEDVATAHPGMDESVHIIALWLLTDRLAMHTLKTDVPGAW